MPAQLRLPMSVLALVVVPALVMVVLAALVAMFLRGGTGTLRAEPLPPSPTQPGDVSVGKGEPQEDPQISSDLGLPFAWVARVPQETLPDAAFPDPTASPSEPSGPQSPPATPTPTASTVSGPSPSPGSSGGPSPTPSSSPTPAPTATGVPNIGPTQPGTLGTPETASPTAADERQQSSWPGLMSPLASSRPSGVTGWSLAILAPDHLR